MKVYFREWEDGDYELGVLVQDFDGHYTMDTGDWLYSSWLAVNYPPFVTPYEWLSKWTEIGEL